MLLKGICSSFWFPINFEELNHRLENIHPISIILHNLLPLSPNKQTSSIKFKAYLSSAIPMYDFIWILIPFSLSSSIVLLNSRTICLKRSKSGTWFIIKKNPARFSVNFFARKEFFWIFFRIYILLTPSKAEKGIKMKFIAPTIYDDEMLQRTFFHSSRYLIHGFRNFMVFGF